MKEFEIESIGKLLPHPDVPDEWLISKPVSIPFFDELKLSFTFDGDDLKNDDSFSSEANKLIELFLMKNNNDRLIASNLVYQNYRTVQNYYDSQPIRSEPLKLKTENEIWKFIYPQGINVCRDSLDEKNLYLRVECECEWEEEHGLQLIFKNGAELVRVSSIDGHLTD